MNPPNQSALVLPRVLPLLDGFAAASRMIDAGRIQEASETLKRFHKNAMSVKSDLINAQEFDAKKSRP